MSAVVLSCIVISVTIKLSTLTVSESSSVRLPGPSMSKSNASNRGELKSP